MNGREGGAGSEGFAEWWAGYEPVCDEFDEMVARDAWSACETAMRGAKGLEEVARWCAEDVNAILFNRGHVLKAANGDIDHIMPTDEMTEVIAWRLKNALAAASAMPTARGDVFSRPECIFRYCPHPQSCQERCTNENS